MTGHQPFPIRTRLFAGDPWHPAEIVRAGLAPLIPAGFDFDLADTAEAGATTDLETVRLVVLAKANLVPGPDLQPWLKSDADHGLTRFVARGGGLLVVHAGTSRYEHLPALHALIGGAFIRHPNACQVSFTPLADNELTRQADAFSACDEHYFVNVHAQDASVFLRSTSPHGVQPAGWTRVEGEGRVCVLTPGHTPEVWRQPSFQKLLLNGARWAARMN